MDNEVEAECCPQSGTNAGDSHVCCGFFTCCLTFLLFFPVIGLGVWYSVTVAASQSTLAPALSFSFCSVALIVCLCASLANIATNRNGGGGHSDVYAGYFGEVSPMAREQDIRAGVQQSKAFSRFLDVFKFPFFFLTVLAVCLLVASSVVTGLSVSHSGSGACVLQCGQSCCNSVLAPMIGLACVLIMCAFLIVYFLCGKCN